MLVENKLTNQEKYFGRTRCMLPVIFDSENCKPGDLVNVKINSYNQKNLFGVHFTSKTIAAWFKWKQLNKRIIIENFQ